MNDKPILSQLICFWAFTLPCLLNCSMPASASDEETFIQSEHVNYDGDKIELTGNALIKHALGTFFAGHMVLHFPSKDEKVSIGTLQMNDHVRLSFSGGGQLNCAKADLDGSSLTGIFSGNAFQEYVIYTEQGRDNNFQGGSTTPLTVKSRLMSVLLKEDASKTAQSTKHYISQITADDYVTINYNHDFIAIGDHAIYQCNPEFLDEKGVLNPQGLITLKAGDEDGICQVSNSNGDLIKAEKINIDTIKRIFTFSYPKGALQSSGDADQARRVDFSADLLVWDDIAGILMLKDTVEVHQKGIGKLETSKQVRFYQKTEGDQKILKAIETEGDTVLTYHNEDKQVYHTLTCSGPVKVDHHKMETRLYAITDPHEGIPAGKQIFYQDPQGEIYADKVLIKYQLVNRNPVLCKIILAGNVKIYNHLPCADDETKNVMQYVLADRVDFIPNSKEMIFKTLYRGHRVLFFDKANHLQVSAPSLKIMRDLATKKDSIQGIGDVRFSFIESEFQQLRERFLLDNMSADNE